jgi:hypothetical protein
MLTASGLLAGGALFEGDDYLHDPSIDLIRNSFKY